MHEQPISIQSKIRTPFIILMIGSGLLMFTLATVAIIDDMNAHYHSMLLYVLAAMLLGLGVWGIVELLRLRRLHLYNDRIDLYSLTGDLKETIYRSQVRNWKETEHRHQNTARRSKHFTYYTETGKHHFSSTTYQNYEELAAIIKTWAPEADNTAQIRRSYAVAAVMVLVSLVFFGLAIYMVARPSKKMESLQLASVAGTLDENPEVSRPSKGSPHMKLYLREYRGFEFELNDKAFDAANTEAFTREVGNGDKVTFEVNAKDLQKLQQPKPQGCFVLPEYTDVPVYAIRDARQQYLSFTDYSDAYYGDNDPGDTILMFSLFGVVFMAMAAISYARSRKLAHG